MSGRVGAMKDGCVGRGTCRRGTVTSETRLCLKALLKGTGEGGGVTDLGGLVAEVEGGV